MPEIMAGPALVAGLNATFVDTWQKKYAPAAELISSCYQVDVPSTHLVEPYGYYESAPYPERWDRGTDIKSEALEAKSFSVRNHDWAKRIVWHYNDRRDDVLGGLYGAAQQLGENFATLDERLTSQVEQGIVDPVLLPSIPLAPDGLALYAAARFGVAAGNIFTGSGVATESAIYDDFIGAVAQMGLFQDTKGQPLFPPSDINRDFVIKFAYSNLKVFQKAFLRQMSLETVGAAAAAPSNVILSAGYRVTLWPTQRITTNHWFIHAKNVPQKPIFIQAREGITNQFATMENSDVSRTTKQEYVQWVLRKGVGVRIPYATIKVSNP